MRTDDLAWKEFAMKPSLKFLLRGLAGLAASHPATQTALAASIISQLHLMEQMSSEEHLGSLAASDEEKSSFGSTVCIIIRAA